jgi:hypothetical protein
VIFPAPDHAVSELDARRADPELGTLARAGVSLDTLSAASIPGGLEVHHRVLSAMRAYAAATQQDRDDVALLLFVVAAEGLVVPAKSLSWRQDRVVARFIDFFETLMPERLDVMLAHANLEEAFEIKLRGSTRRRRKDLLQRIYDLRSGLVHGELVAERSWWATGRGGGRSVMRALCCDFAEGAILEYISAPRSSLIGHPAVAPSTSAHTTNTRTDGGVGVPDDDDDPAT